MKRLLVRGQPRSGTTILTQLLFGESDLCTTNELYLYDFLFYGAHTNGKRKTNFEFRNKVFKRLDKSRKYIPPQIDVPTVKANLTERINNKQSKLQCLEIVEDELFQGKFKIIADKVHDTLTDKQLDALVESGIGDFKVVWIYRDGRDVCSSNRRVWQRLYKNGGEELANKNPWASNDMAFAGDRWADRMLELVEMEKRLQTRNIPVMRVKFEDFIDNEDLLVPDLADFVEINCKVLAHNVNTMFNSDKHHCGYYTEWIPNWKEEFTDKAKDILEQFGYI